MVEILFVFVASILIIGGKYWLAYYVYTVFYSGHMGKKYVPPKVETLPPHLTQEQADAIDELV